MSSYNFNLKSTPKRHEGKCEVDPKLQAMFPLPSGLRASVQSYFTPSTYPKKHRTEEEYFDSPDGEDLKPNTSDLEYLPAPGSPSASSEAKTVDDDEDDPLDAYMTTIEATALRDLKSIGKNKTKNDRGIREDIEKEDDQETFFRWLEENPNAGVSLVEPDENDDDREIDYDDDGNIIVPEKSKWIDPLPAIDHSKIQYKPFEKNFYTEHAEIRSLTNEQVIHLSQKLNITATGFSVPKPVSSFAHFGFDFQLMSMIRKYEFTQPTAIQAQAIPAIMSGRDVIGIAQTGSGKTCAYLWPALIHIMDQPNLEVNDGPIVLICAPTRELAQQIHGECKKYGKVYNIHSVCAYGGGSLYEQSQACKEGCEILVCTPGRLIDLVKKKSVNLLRVTYLVFDEADRMFDMGFEPQVRSIADHIRPDRQCLLFSATFRRKVERLTRDILTDPIKIVQGELGEVNENITQVVELLSPTSKWPWLINRLVEFTTLGKVLIFVTRKENCEELAKNLKDHDFKVGLLHGDIGQLDRNSVIGEFKKELPILVATDVAARGLDIKDVKTVVNYDVARDIDTHIHRIGRTARAGAKGFAFTLVTKKDLEFIPHLVRNLEQSSQFVPPELLELALQVPWFSKTRQTPKEGKKINAGLGYRERPVKNTMGPMADYRGVSATGSQITGPQGHRLSALKQAFQTQFKSNFVPASIDAGWKSASSVAVPSSATQKRAGQSKTDNRKRTRWSD